MAKHTTMLHVRIDDNIKKQATTALNVMGISVSDAVRLFLNRVVADQAFPFELKVPNTQTRAAMHEAEEIVRTRDARLITSDELFIELEKDNSK